MTPPVMYYTLDPIVEPLADASAVPTQSKIIGLRPVDLPGTINRTQMVTRSGPHQLAISSLNRWADYPNQLVQQTIGENLQTLMPDTRIVIPPWPMGLKPDVILTIKINEMIGTAAQQVLFSAVWTITAADLSLSDSHRLNLTEPVMGKGYDELAAAHSRVLEAFCRKMADSLRTFHS